VPTAWCAQGRSRFWRTRQRLCEVSPRGPRPSSQGDGGCRRAVRPVGARAGPCTGTEAIAGCVALRKVHQPTSHHHQVRKNTLHSHAMDKPPTNSAVRPRRPTMASLLEKEKVGQGRCRCTEDVTSSPQTMLPQPGDHFPCLPYLSVQIVMLCVGECVLACAAILVERA
jgi:hypothetical protein